MALSSPAALTSTKFAKRTVRVRPVRKSRILLGLLWVRHDSSVHTSPLVLAIWRAHPAPGGTGCLCCRRPALIVCRDSRVERGARPAASRRQPVGPSARSGAAAVPRPPETGCSPSPRSSRTSSPRRRRACGWAAPAGLRWSFHTWTDGSSAQCWRASNRSCGQRSWTCCSTRSGTSTTVGCSSNVCRPGGRSMPW